MNLPLDHKSWQAGLKLDRFVQSMQTNRLEMQRRLKVVRLGETDLELLSNIDRPAHVLVMTEDWCGDSLMNLPILVRIIETAPHIDLRLYPRHAWPDLEAYFQQRGISHIPVFWFLDFDFNEFGVWVERSKAASERLDEWAAAHPLYNSIRTSPDLTREEKRARLAPFLAERQLEMEGWYEDKLQSAAVAEIAALLRPA